MNVFQIALLVGAVVVAALAWRIPRAIMWIIAGALSFVASTAYARFDLPYPPAFTAACDVAVCLGVYFFGQLRWELHLWRLFQLSVLVSIAHLAGVIGPHYAYIVALETINWLALFLIAGTAIMARVGENGMGSGRWTDRRLRWANRTLHEKRATAPFTARR